MRLQLKKCTTKDLEIGSFYLCDRPRADYSSINVYIGKNYKGFYVFYNVLNIRVVKEDTSDIYSRLKSKQFVNLGTDNMMKMYSDVIQESLSLSVIKSNIRTIASLSCCFNKIDFGFDAKEFIEREKDAFDFGQNNKLKQVTKKSLVKNTVYITSDFTYLYTFLDVGKAIGLNYSDDKKVPMSYIFDCKYYVWPDKFASRMEERYYIPKMYKLEDVMNNKFAVEELKHKNIQLYKYICDNKKV